MHPIDFACEQRFSTEWFREVLALELLVEDSKVVPFFELGAQLFEVLNEILHLLEAHTVNVQICVCEAKSVNQTQSCCTY